MRRAVVYVAIRGDPTGRFYVYRYVVASPTKEEGCGVVCSGCGGDKVWYMAIQRVLEEVRSRYGEVELRTHFSHLAKGLFRLELGNGASVKYVDKESNLALKGIDKCLVKNAAQPASHVAHSRADSGDPHRWQYEFLDEFGVLLTVEVAPVVALSAPTGSGKTKAALEASKLAVDKGLASLAVAVGRTKTQHEAFIRDNERFGIGFVPVRIPSKESACIQIRMAPPPPPDWDEEERTEYIKMMAKSIKCADCPLNSTPRNIDPAKLRRIVLEATYDKRNENDEKYVEKIEEAVRKELGNMAWRESICAYSVVKTAARQMVADGLPVLLLGSYPHIFSSARSIVKQICTAQGEEDDEEADEADERREAGKKGDDAEACAAVVVVDEAHNLWRIIGEFGRYTVSDVRIMKVAEGLNDLCKERPQEHICASLKERLEETYRKNQPGHPMCKKFDVVEVFRPFAEELGRLAVANSSKKAVHGVETKVSEDVAEKLRETLEGLLGILESACGPYKDKKNDDARINRACILLKAVKKFLRVLKPPSGRYSA